MKFISSGDVGDALPFDRLIPALKEMFLLGCNVPMRHVHAVPAVESENKVLIMPAWQAGEFLGVKTVTVFPENHLRELPSIHSLYSLYDACTGRPLAIMDGAELTSRRTAAVSALAASYLAPPTSKVLLVVGSGRVARLLALAYRIVLPIERVIVWSRNEAHARALVDELHENDIEAISDRDLARAAARADVISCATLSTRPLIQGKWLLPTSHLDLIGGFTPTMREADNDCFLGSKIYVDTKEAIDKSGDLLVPIAQKVIAANDIIGDLAQLVRSEVPCRSAGGRTVFKSVGTALEDLAAARLVYQSSPSPGSEV